MSRDFSANLGTFRTDVKQGDTGLWYATSPDLKGFMVAEESLPEVRRRIPDALYVMLQAAQAEIAALKRENEEQRKDLVSALDQIRKLATKPIGSFVK